MFERHAPLLIAFLVITFGQYIRISHMGPTLASLFQAVLYLLAALSFYMAFVGRKFGHQLASVVSVLFGVYYGISVYTLMVVGDSFALGQLLPTLICLVAGLYALFKGQSAEVVESSISPFIWACIPAGYLLEMSLHMAYPREAHILLLLLQMTSIVLFVAWANDAGKIWNILFFCSLAAITVIFLVYAFTNITGGVFIPAIQYLAYAVLVGYCVFRRVRLAWDSRH